MPGRSTGRRSSGGDVAWALAAAVVAAAPWRPAMAAAQPPPAPDEAADPQAAPEPGGSDAPTAGDTEAPPPRAAPFVAWRYRTPEGRLVYTSSLGAVPAGARDLEPVDLSRQTLNVEIGNGLRDHAPRGPAPAPPAPSPPPEDRTLAPEEVTEALGLEAERARLVRTAECEAARGGKAPPLHERLLTDHVHLPIFAAVAFLLVGAGPSMARRMAAPQWIRFVAFVLPMLAFLSFTTSTVVEAARLQRRLRQAAEVCDPRLDLGPLDSAAALERRLDVVETLRAVVGHRGLSP